MTAVPGPRLAVIGLRVVGTAVARAAVARRLSVVAVDDRPTDVTRATAEELRIPLTEAPDPAALARVIAGVDTVVASPGIPDRHPVHALAADAGVPVVSEYDLAAAWDDRPCLAVTGTDGKTTVTTEVAAMLVRSGRRAVVAGNAEVPLVAAIDDPTVEVFVVEASSFGLGQSSRFAPRVGTWLNFAPDHQDAHADLDRYRAAKARIWQNLGPGDLAVANADDAVVARVAADLHGDVQTFGVAASADWSASGGHLRAPGGEPFVAVADLPRAFPHDLSNTLAAAATAVAGGANLEAVADVARTFAGLPHRVSLVGEAGGVRFYDDSKATAPHATLAAVGGFESVVLIAGGRNKGLDLGVLAEAADHVRSVVAIGEAADDVARAFDGLRPVDRAASMADAVAAALGRAEVGDVVLLSPGCASFDWYGSYAERGDDFIRAVREQLGVGG